MSDLKDILTNKIIDGLRISEEEALTLYSFEMSQLSTLATLRKKEASDLNVFYNKNLHIEPTNFCIYNCRFCSYRAKNNADGYVLTQNEIIEKISGFANKITEVHITGGVHPEWGINFFANLLQKIKQKFPQLHIKAFTATEIEHMCNIDNLSIKEGLKILKQSGLSSLPGGGAEIFDDEIREKISPEKPSAKTWLEIHRLAHLEGLQSNATMLFGHIENRLQRIKHMSLIRELQDETKGFNAFIPLKFRNKNNSMSNVKESSTIEDLKTFAIARIYLDNIPHIKTYWPAIGKNFAQISLLFGVDDLDGTINDSTTIYMRAGSAEIPSISVDELQNLILKSGFIPKERDSLYNPI